MSNPVRNYFQALFEGIGGGWNRFWFTPSSPVPLAALRILAGILLLWSHWSYTGDLDLLFGRQGLLPPDRVEQIYINPSPEGVERFATRMAMFSYLNFAQNSGQLWVLHIAGFFVIGTLIVGFRSRTAAVLAVIVHLSYMHRAPLYTGQFESILAFLLFYLCVGPCGACWSLDRWMLDRRAAKNSAVSQPAFLLSGIAPSYQATIAIRLLQVHTCLVFAMMFIGMLGSPSPEAPWWTGQAVWWLLARVETRPFDLTALGTGRQGEKLMEVWTHVIVWFEGLFALLVWNRLARPLMIVLLVVMWAPLLALATGLYAFALAMAVAGLAFVSGEAWLELASLVSGGRVPAPQRVLANA